MVNPVEGAVRVAVGDAVAAAGLYLEDVSVSRAGSRSVVRVTVDLPEDETGGVDLDRVADVSRAVSDALDAADAVPGHYTLEVGTPGTSRPLTEPRHFRRARGRLVKIVLRDGGTVQGRVLDADDTGVVLVCPDVTGTERRVLLEDVAKAAVEVELKRMAEADLGDDDEEA
ncbi:hypothetical protein GCM10025865_32180 [Paraoerskovia sediminicola]|uniref:Ribosome maturation factor RimP n=1 Tax=Paraoerskovia sediminicola TaxID=1138587 RepID=A0ABN6XGF4_9CELL|nr:ribosome maturation factor RimP [Paraoerskovia sediminicola]BDZ43919.1 hypothetical protein GCM10025865_32180 [Paraoerskovia sediminicola]